MGWRCTRAPPRQTSAIARLRVRLRHCVRRPRLRGSASDVRQCGPASDYAIARLRVRLDHSAALALASWWYAPQAATSESARWAWYAQGRRRAAGAGEAREGSLWRGRRAGGLSRNRDHEGPEAAQCCLRAPGPGVAHALFVPAGRTTGRPRPRRGRLSRPLPAYRRPWPRMIQRVPPWRTVTAAALSDWDCRCDCDSLAVTPGRAPP